MGRNQFGWSDYSQIFSFITGVSTPTSPGILGPSEITANLYYVHLYWEGFVICSEYLAMIHYS